MESVLRLLKKRHIFANLAVGNKKELLDLLIDSFKEDVSEKEFQSIDRAVRQRETMLSTGVGNGVAIPHGQSSAIKNRHAALAVLNAPVNYDSFDDQPVSVAFLFAGPDSQDHSHLSKISEISRLMNNENFRQGLIQQQTREDLYHYLKGYN